MQTPLAQDALATMRGNWLSHLDFDIPGVDAWERVWTIDDLEGGSFHCVPEADRLPTDCSFREDAIKLAAGDVMGAQAAKDRIEEKQRKERKLRPKTHT